MMNRNVLFERTDCMECINNPRKLALRANSIHVSSSGKYMNVLGGYIATALSVDFEFGAKLSLAFATGVDRIAYAKEMLSDVVKQQQCEELFSRLDGMISNERRLFIDKEVAHILFTQ